MMPIPKKKVIGTPNKVVIKASSQVSGWRMDLLCSKLIFLFAERGAEGPGNDIRKHIKMLKHSTKDDFSKVARLCPVPLQRIVS